MYNNHNHVLTNTILKLRQRKHSTLEEVISIISATLRYGFLSLAYHSELLRALFLRYNVFTTERSERYIT